MESDRPCCMVCMECDGALYRSPCRCKNVLVHAECFSKMIERPNYRSSCAVCRAPYGRAVAVHVERELTCASPAHVGNAIVMWLMLVLDILLAVYASVATAQLDGEPRQLMLVVCVCLWGPAFLALLVSMVGRACCCDCLVQRRYVVDVSSMVLV